MDIKIKKLRPDAVIPQYAYPGSSGFDLVAIEDYIVYPGHTVLVKTGLAFSVPVGFELQVRPRSGLSLKTKLRICNSPGTVDSFFHGEVCVIIENIQEPFSYGGVRTPPYEIKKGDRIAQGVICPVYQANFVEVEDLGESERGTNGFGSSGK